MRVREPPARAQAGRIHRGPAKDLRASRSGIALETAPGAQAYPWLMRRLLWAWGCAGIVIGCGGDDLDEAGARELWQRLQAADYRAWQRAPGWEERRPTVSAHGHTADIFINPVLTAALDQSGLDAWPVDSLLVKDSYRGDALHLIAAMEKRSARWYYAEWDARGGAKYAGSPEVCLDCHGSAPDRVFALTLP